jgi:hypothetical protein
MSQEARERLLEKMKLQLIENAKFKAWERARLREESDYWTDQTENEVAVRHETDDTADSRRPQDHESDTQEKIQTDEKKRNVEIKYARALENLKPQNEDELRLRKVRKERNALRFDHNLFEKNVNLVFEHFLCKTQKV